MSDALPPLAALHAFALLAETGSLAAVAARLGLTQPAVSKRVRSLERHLGVALVRRGANALSLTDAGQAYAAALGAFFDGLRTATETLNSRGAGPLRVRAYTTWALRWLIPRLPRFRAQHGGLEVEVTTSLAAVDFARDAVDAAIRTAGDGPPAPRADRLHAVDVAPYAAPAAARNGLAGLTLLGSRARPVDWAIWHGEAAAPTAPLLFESTTLAIGAAIEGLGAVITPPVFVTEEVRRRRLRPLGPTAATGDYYWLLLPCGVARPEALAFRAWLLEEVAADSPART